jgi:hypothetical protein
LFVSFCIFQDLGLARFLLGNKVALKQGQAFYALALFNSSPFPEIKGIM